MPVLAFEPERLAALQRAVDDLEFALGQLCRSLPPEMSTVWGSIQREMARCRAQQEKVVGVLRSDLERLGPLPRSSNHWTQPRSPHPTDSQLAQHAKNTVLSWTTTHPSWWAKATHGQPTDIDTILQSLITNPRAASMFLDSLDDFAPLIYGAHDTDLVRAFWLQVTDPATTSPEIAGRRIRALLTTIFGDHEWSQGLSRSSIVPQERRRIEQSAIDMLGEIIAPWQFSFAGQASDWSWTSSAGITWLQKVAASPIAAADLARGLGPSVIRTLSHLPPSPADRRQHIDDVAFSIGVSLEVLHQAGITHAGRDIATWKSFDEFVDLSPVNAPWPFSILVERGATWLDDRLLTDQESLSEKRMRQRNTLSGQQVLAGLAVLTVWRSQWKQAFAMRASPMQSPTAKHQELQHTYDAIDSPSARGRVVAR